MEGNSEWKKRKFISYNPIHKKNDKQCLKNYRLVSLQPIYGKNFEKLIFNEMFEFFLENEIFSSNQAGFAPGDS